jgi:hypothetical protein
MAKTHNKSTKTKDGLAKKIEEQRKETIEEGITPDYLPNAPPALIYRHKHPNPFKGQDILGRLLTDLRMKRIWKLIEKRCSGVPDYPRLWSQISYAFAKSRIAEPSRTKKHDHFLGIKRDAEQLAKTIENGPLDRLAYEYFPDDWAQRVFKADKWSVLGPDDRTRIAHRRINWWPSLTDLLAEVVRYAEQFSKESLTEERFGWAVSSSKCNG